MSDETRSDLQHLVDTLFQSERQVSRLDAVIRAEVLDIDPRARELIDGLPPGEYLRHRLCDQINSALKARGLTGILATVD